MGKKYAGNHGRRVVELVDSKVHLESNLDRLEDCAMGTSLVKNLGRNYDYKTTFKLGPKGSDGELVRAKDISYCTISRACPATLDLLMTTLSHDYDIMRIYASRIERENLAAKKGRIDLSGGAA